MEDLDKRLREIANDLITFRKEVGEARQKAEGFEKTTIRRVANNLDSAIGCLRQAIGDVAWFDVNKNLS